jgi:arylsulfatase
MHVGLLLDKLDELGIADNMIVLYTSDYGPHNNSWPDAGVSPFRSEKETNREGAFRVPALIRWPGRIDPGQISNEIVSGLDWLPTFVAAAGEPEIASKLLKGYRAGKQSFKVHLDGYNLIPYLTGDKETSPRESFFYFNDDTQLVGIRFHNWKLVFPEQRAPGTLQVWAEPFTELRLPKMFDLRADPYEQADITSNTYHDWQLRHAFLIVPAQQYAAQFLETFRKFPPRQAPTSFNLEEVMRNLSEAGGG